MADIELSLSLIPSSLTRPVLDGRCPIEGATVQGCEATSVNTNSREMLQLKYDVAEMSLATFTKAKELKTPIVALPIFPGRRFVQAGAMVAKSAGIHDLAELRGRRAAVTQFWVTSSVWHRLVLRQIHGVAQNELTWITTADERLGDLHLPPEAHLDASGRSPRDLLLAGEAEAMLTAGGGPGDGKPDERIVSAFPDPVAAQREYYERTGVFPIVHLIVMKEELAQRNPELVEALCNAFERAKEVGLSSALAEPAERPITGLSENDTRALFGDDPWPYGLAPNRKTLDLFVTDVRDQGMVDRPMTVEELFAPNLPAAYR